MRLLITILILTLHLTITFGQSETSQTEIIIIGTIHNGNKFFNNRTLFDVLKKKKPDIILWEQSIKFKRVFGLRTANFLKIWKPGIKQLSLQKYSRLNKSIKILPFDTSFNSRRQYIGHIFKIKQAFFDSLNIYKMSFSDSMLYADYAKKRNNYYDLIINSDLIKINKSDVTEMTKILYNLDKNYILPLGKKYIRDSLLLKNFEDDLTFWFVRNNYMVNKIKEYSNQFAGQRIIILTGLNHKYYLQDKLLETERKTIRLLELNDD